MFKWLSNMASPRAPPSPKEVTVHRVSGHDNMMMTDLVLAEVETQVVRLEVDKEQSRSRQQLNSKMPDYSWLVSADVRPKKYLTIQEKFRLERACERLKAEEWASVLELFRKRTKDADSREHILGEFAAAAHEVIASRPRTVSVNDVLRKYTRSASSVNAVSYSATDMDGGHVQVGDSYNQPQSARTVAGGFYGHSFDHIV